MSNNERNSSEIFSPLSLNGESLESSQVLKEESEIHSKTMDDLVTSMDANVLASELDDTLMDHTLEKSARLNAQEKKEGELGDSQTSNADAPPGVEPVDSSIASLEPASPMPDLEFGSLNQSFCSANQETSVHTLLEEQVSSGNGLHPVISPQAAEEPVVPANSQDELAAGEALDKSQPEHSGVNSDALFGDANVNSKSSAEPTINQVNVELQSQSKDTETTNGVLSSETVVNEIIGATPNQQTNSRETDDRRGQSQNEESQVETDLGGVGEREENESRGQVPQEIEGDATVQGEDATFTANIAGSTENSADSVDPTSAQVPQLDHDSQFLHGNTTNETTRLEVAKEDGGYNSVSGFSSGEIEKQGVDELSSSATPLAPVPIGLKEKGGPLEAKLLTETDVPAPLPLLETNVALANESEKEAKNQSPTSEEKKFLETVYTVETNEPGGSLASTTEESKAEMEKQENENTGESTKVEPIKVLEEDSSEKVTEPTTIPEKETSPASQVECGVTDQPKSESQPNEEQHVKDLAGPRVTDFFQNGLLVKTTLTEPADPEFLPRPDEVAEVCLKCFVAKDGTLLDECSVLIELGENVVPSGLEMGIRSMSVGEEADLLVASKYAYQSFSWDFPLGSIEPDTDLRYHIKLINILPFPEAKVENFDEIYSICREKKELGKNYFDKGAISYASSCYLSALKRMKHVKVDGHRQFKLLLENNLALCCYKQSQYYIVVERLERVLKKYPNNAKALHRISLALEQIGETEKAAHYIKKLYSIMPNDPKTEELYTRILTKHHKNSQKVNQMYAKMLSRTSTKMAEPDSVEGSQNSEQDDKSQEPTNHSYLYWTIAGIASFVVAASATAYAFFKR